MRAFLIIVLLVLSLSKVLSQSQTHFNIYFPTNEFRLSEKSKSSLDSIIITLKNMPEAFSITVIGHTDNVGSKSYNQSLSLKRASETKNYFLNKGFKYVKHSGHSLNEPIADNNSEQGKQQNRRVEIIIKSKITAVESIGGFGIKDKPFKIKTENGGIYEQASGTKLLIPPSAFIDKNGKEVNGEIEIVYREYRDPVDFIFSNIPMSIMTDGGLYPFNSAGMFKILAYKNGQPVYLKEGKNIQVEFAVTENLANLNFYRFDTVGNQWAEMAKLTDQHAVAMSNDLVIRMPCVLVNGEKVCNMDECDAIYFIVNAGIKYAKSDKSIEEELKLSDSLNSQKGVIDGQVAALRGEKVLNLKRIDSLDKSAKPIQHYYKIRKIKASSKTTFSIECTVESENEFAGLENVTWVYDSPDMTQVHKEIFKANWKTCHITHQGSDFSIELKEKSGSPVRLDNVKMFFKPKGKKKNREATKNKIYVKYDSAYQNYQVVIGNIDSLRNELLTKDTIIQRKIDSLLNYKQYADSISSMLNRDSLFCFWSNSKKYMSAEELPLKFKEWIKHFDQNKAAMLARYQKIKEEKDYKACEDIAKAKLELAKQIEEQRKLNEKFNQKNNGELNSFMTIGGSESNFKKGEDLKKTKQIFQSLSIGNLGIYNCDQISRLKDPVITINANYEDEKQNKLTIMLIYIIDNSFNGIMRYDGLNGYGPGNFKCSASSRNTLIAFDEKFNAYIFKPEKFEGIKTSGKHTFTLEKVNNIKSKEDLNLK